MINEKQYERQINVSSIGIEGQIKICKSNVVIIGVGGLGTAVLLYLARMGVGKFKLIDNDTVALSNLPRQVLYYHDDLGKEKVKLAGVEARRINPNLCVETISARICDDNIATYVSECDVIVQCVDNIDTRRVVSRYAKLNGYFLVEGAVDGFRGTVKVFDSNSRESYESIYKNYDGNNNPTAVMSSTVGVVGSIMANEVIKRIVGLPTSLTNNILYLDLQRMDFRKINLETL